VLEVGENLFEYERVVQPRPKWDEWQPELDGLLAGMQPRLLASRLNQLSRLLYLRAAL